MAPLYTSAPIVPDESSVQVETKLTVDVALATLSLIEEVLDSLQVPTAKKGKKSRRRAFKTACARVSVSVVTFCLFAALAVSAVILWIKALDDVRRCRLEYEDATAEDAPPDKTADPEVNVLVNTVELSLELACRLTERTDLIKASWWRWLAFFATWFPLGLIGQLLARLIAVIVGSYALGSNAVFLTFGLHTQLGYVIRSGLWFGAWFALMHSPRQWAEKAGEWNDMAAVDDMVVWNDKFDKVHRYMSRALLAYVLLCVCGLLRAACAKYLSLKFHHRNHFERMQKALVQENVVQVLSKPNSLAKSTVVTSMGRSIELKGLDCAHWAALKFVSRIVDGDDDIFGQVDHCSPDKLQEIKERAIAVQLRLAELLSSDVLHHSDKSARMHTLFSGMTPELSSGPHATPTHRSGSHRFPPDATDPIAATNSGPRPTPNGATAVAPAAGAQQNPLYAASMRAQAASRKSAEVPYMHAQSMTAFDPADDSSVLFVPGEERVVPEEFMRAAVAQVAEARLQGHTAQMRIAIDAPASARTASMRKAMRDAAQRAQDAELPERTAEAIEAIEETMQAGPWWRRRPADQAVRSQETKKAQRIASRLAAAKEEPTVNVHSTVNQLQSYLMDNSHIRVFFLDDQSDEDSSTIDTSMSARQLGYYIFFNLRQQDSGLAIRKHEVDEAAAAAGLRHVATAWELFDRNSDACATMEEVVDGVQQVYYNRKSLARTLVDSQNVVEQVENALGVTLFIAWVFVTAAIFDSGAVQRTWTALSAGLLSFSFIFGGSVRELFENAIFLFFTHPFDVGDIIFFEGSRYRVKAIALQYVNIGRVDGADVSVPTAEMRAARLHNVSRSDLMWDDVQLAVDLDTPRSALDTVAAYVLACIKANPKLFGGSYRVWWTDALQAHKLELSVFYDHHDNGSDLITVNLARTAMHDAVASALRQDNVSYTLPPVRGQAPPPQEMASLRHTLDAGASAGGADTAANGSGADGEQARAAAAQMVLLA